MANKDVRPLLSALSSDFLISTQEVPRSADRNPTRTFYLWWVTPENDDPYPQQFAGTSI